MKFHLNKKYIYWALTGALSIVLGILFYYILFHRANLSSAFGYVVKVSMPIIDGLILAYLMTPIVNAIENRILKPIYAKGKVELNEKSKRRMRTFAIILTVIIVLILAYEFLAMIIPELISSIQSIYSQFPSYVNNLTVWVTGLLEDNPKLESMVMDLLDKYSAMLTDFLNTSILPRLNDILKILSSSVLGFLVATKNFVIGFIISIYIMSNKELYAGQSKKIIYAFFEKITANHIISNFRFIHNTFIGFIVGKIIDSAIIGVICFICTTLIGTPYAILISVVIGVTNIIPFFGPWLGAIPCALLILMVDPLQCLYFVIMILIIQQFDGNILGPKILGDSTGLSSFWVIFAITVFGGIFGVPGMIVGVPIFAVIYAGIKSVVNKQLAKKELPTSTQPYLMVGSIEEDNSFTEYAPIKKKKEKVKNSRFFYRYKTRKSDKDKE